MRQAKCQPDAARRRRPTPNSKSQTLKHPREARWFGKFGTWAHGVEYRDFLGAGVRSVGGFDRDVISALQQALGVSRVLTAPEDILPYGFDGTAVLRQRPRAVVFARTASEVAGVLKLARAHRTPVVTRGSGTGLSGGSVPVEGGIVLCLVEMNRILEVDTANLTLTAEPGVITQAIFSAADSVGLFYPPDPGSIKVSTIGGNVAENSGGLRGLKYGVTRDYVMGLEVVLADGTICWLGNKCVKDVAG